MKKNESTPPAAAVLGAAVLVGFVLTLLFMAVCALAILLGALEADRIGMWADLCLAIGSLCAAFLAARRSASWQLLWGIAAGVLLFGCLVILSFAWFGQPVQISRLLINAILSIVSAAVGGALGARQRRHRRRKK